MIITPSLLLLILVTLVYKCTTYPVSAERYATDNKMRLMRRLELSSEYEVWASDQSNSVKDAVSAGVMGSFIWIWNSESIQN